MNVDYNSWLKNVLFWDTFLPVCIALAPVVIRLLFPNIREILEIVSITFPIVALFLRFRSGFRRIASNRCSSSKKESQQIIFVFGILPLVLIECVLMLSSLMPPGPDQAVGLLLWAIWFPFYLAAMTFAMYPGRSTVDWDDEDRFSDDLL